MLTMPSDTSPTSRALLLLELLQQHPGITADRLSSRLGVTTRAVRRYVEILREAEIPVHSERGPGGGYWLGRGIRLPPLVFSAPEALGLVMAVLDGHHQAGDPNDPVGSALGKLLRALPEAVATPARTVRGVAAPVPNRSAVRPDPQLTVVLVQACGEHRRVRVSYRSEAGTEFAPEVEPWAVVVRHSRWYLLCRMLDTRSGDTGDTGVGEHVVRAFRVDRIRSVDLLAESFVPPADLDPVATLEDHLAVGWEYECRVVLDGAADDLRPWVPRSLGRLEPVDNAHCRLVATTSNPDWYTDRLVGLQVPFRVEGGPELRGAVARLAERLRLAVSGS